MFVSLLQVLTPVQVQALQTAAEGAGTLSVSAAAPPAVTQDVQPAAEPVQQDNMKSVIKAALLRAIERKKKLGQLSSSQSDGVVANPLFCSCCASQLLMWCGYFHVPYVCLCSSGQSET